MDPSQMSDEELDAAITGEQPVETPTKEEPIASPEKEEQPESPAEDAPAEPETPADEEPEVAPAPSRREQLRVNDLLSKYGPPPDKQAPSKPAPKAPDYSEILDADPEVIEQLDKSTRTFGSDEYNRGKTETLQQINTVKWETLLNIDAPAVESEYSVLNRKSPDFHPALSDTMNKLYLNYVGYDPKTGLVQNPGVRYRDFVDSYMELADEIAVSKTTNTAKNIAKQVAATGLRPDGSTAKKLNLNQAPENMTDEELDAVIEQAIPRDSRGRFTK